MITDNYQDEIPPKLLLSNSLLISNVSCAHDAFEMR